MSAQEAAHSADCVCITEDNAAARGICRAADERDRLEDLFGSGNEPVPDDPQHCFNCGNDLPCLDHNDEQEAT